MVVVSIKRRLQRVRGCVGRACRCEGGLRTCVVSASNAEFGADPCVNTRKYLQVNYRCLSSATVDAGSQLPVVIHTRIAWIFTRATLSLYRCSTVVKVDRRIRWHYTTTILRLRIGARLTRYRNNVNFTISLALSADTLMASAGTPYRLVPVHFYPWCCINQSVDFSSGLSGATTARTTSRMMSVDDART